MVFNLEETYNLADYDSVSDAEAEIDAVLSQIVKTFFGEGLLPKFLFELEACMEALFDEKLISKTTLNKSNEVAEQLQDPYDDEDFEGEYIVWFLEVLVEDLKKLPDAQ